MSVESKQQNLDSKEIVGTNQFAVTGKVELSEDKPLQKLLSANVFSGISSSEQIDTTVSFAGKMQVAITYLSAENNIEETSAFIDYDSSMIVGVDNYNLSVEILEFNTEETAQSITFNILANATARGVCNNKIDIIEEFPEDFVADYYTTSLNKYISSGEGKFVITDNTELIDGSKVLFADANACVTSVNAGLDQTTVNGYVDLKLYYKQEDRIAAITKKIEFNQEISVTDATNNSLAKASVKVNAITFTQDEKSVCMTTVSLECVAEAYQVEELELVKDVYSIGKQLNLNYACTNYSNFIERKYFKEQLTASFEVDDATEILYVNNAKVTVAKVLLESGKIILEGIVNFDFVYKSGDEISSSKINLPFVKGFDCKTSGHLQNNYASAFVTNIILRSNKDVDVSVDINYETDIFADTYFEYINGVEEGEQKTASSSAITIYVTKPTDTIYSVSKALNILPETLISQNEIVDGKFVQGQKIFVYNPLNVEF